MKIIIPMAGMGTRMRPHTLVTPKPLLMISGKTIVERIIVDLKKYTGGFIEEVHYVIGRFGSEVEAKLIEIAEGIGAKGFIHYQDVAMGTAHAVYCAGEALEGEVIVAFADTMFVGNMGVNKDEQAIIWTLRVENPESYGVVITDEENSITGFIEKPKNRISDKAIIGIYYFQNAGLLKDEIENLIRNKVTVKGEYQLTDALENLLSKGVIFKCKTIEQWLDCGNKKLFLESTRKILKREFKEDLKENTNNIRIIQPVYIGKNTVIKNSEIGPNVSIEDNVKIEGSSIRDSNIGRNTEILGSSIYDSIIGNFCRINNIKGVMSIGDYSEYENT